MPVGRSTYCSHNKALRCFLPFKKLITSLLFWLTKQKQQAWRERDGDRCNRKTQKKLFPLGECVQAHKHLIATREDSHRSTWFMDLYLKSGLEGRPLHRIGIHCVVRTICLLLVLSREHYLSKIPQGQLALAPR